MTLTTKSLNWLSWIGAALALATIGCMPDTPPEADPPEVEVSGGELPEYDYDAAELEEEEEDRLALEPMPDRDGRGDDFQDAERFLVE